MVQSGQAPPPISVAKVFFNPQLAAIKQEFTNVKDLGSAAAEEWLKGLEDRGKELRNDAARWEKWEITGGVTRMRNAENKEVRKTTMRAVNSTLALGNLQHPLPMPPTNGHFQGIPNHGSPRLRTPPQLLAQVPQSVATTFRMLSSYIFP